jgi:tubulin polyglutamylase TTLL5
MTNNMHDIPRCQSLIVSRYIANPLTIDSLKFDLRIYAVITSINPLRLYLYEEGLTRFASEPYVTPEADANLNKYVHLTNYSINKLNKSGVKANSLNSNSDEVETSGSKWSLNALKKVLRAHGVNEQKLFARIKDIIIKTVIACEPALNQAFDQNVPFKSNCFQLLGFDIMVDDNLNPWLLEVNLSPSLSCDSQLDHKIKSALVSDLLTLAGLHNLE